VLLKNIAALELVGVHFGLDSKILVPVKSNRMRMC